MKLNTKLVTDAANLLLIVLTTLLVTYLYGKIDYTISPYDEWDLRAYRAMAESVPHINPAIEQPFAFRLSGTFLAGLLPFSIDTNFYLLTLGFSILLLWQFYHLLRYCGLRPNIALLMVLSFLFNKGLFGFTLWDYFQINDILSLNLLLLLFMAIWEKRWLLFAVALLAGAATREVCLLAIPVTLVYLWETDALKQHGKQALMAMLPGALLFCLLRLFIPHEGGMSLPEAFLFHWNKIVTMEAIVRLWITAFLPFSFVPLICLQQTRDFFHNRKYMLLFVALVLVSTLFGYNYERLMAPAFIVFYLLTGTLLQKMDLSKPLEAGVLLLLFMSSLHHLMAHFPLPNLYWTMAFNVIPLLGISWLFYSKAR